MPFDHRDPGRAAADVAAIRVQGGYHRPAFDHICNAETCLRIAHWRLGDPSEFVPVRRPVRRDRRR